MNEAEKNQGSTISSVPGIQRKDQFQDRYRKSIGLSCKGQMPRTLSPREDTVTWYQDFEKSQKTRRRLFLRKEASHPGEWSEKGSPARDPVDNIEWKAKLPVKEKVDLLKVEQVGMVPA